MTNKQKYIVIIEDDPVLRELTEMALTLDGYKVDVFENGAQGIAYLEKNIDRVDLILLDLYMPVLDGMQVLGWLRKIQGTSVSVVIMTAMIDTVTSETLMLAGADKVMQKPLDMSMLITSVKEFLVD